VAQRAARDPFPEQAPTPNAVTDRTVPYYPGLAPLVSGYDGFIIDLWGVVHDGVTLYPGVADCLARLHDGGKRVVMLSNAPRRAATVAGQMIELGVDPAHCRHVMSSGEAVYQELARRDHPWYGGLGHDCLHIGPPRDRGLLDGLGLNLVERVEDAALILNTGPWRDGATVAEYEPVLARGAAADIAMVCANPDLEVVRGGRRIICAGALAARYEALGGRVRYLGKPRPAIYDACFAALGIDDRARILAIGDSFRTDIAGAAAVGVDAALVLGGLHGEALGFAPDSDSGPPPAEAAAIIAASCKAAGLWPVAALPGLVW
jgi:HAD superfamily hydrolase (TIGR01459 family)